MRKETLLSIVLAIGVVTAALWVADQSLRTKAGQQQVGHAMENGGAGSKVLNYSSAEKSEADSGAASSMKQANNQGAPAESAISKCIINGKTIYSNNGCPDGTLGRAVTIHDSQGIVSPPKETLAELTAKRQAAEQAKADQGPQRIALVGASNGAECTELDNRIAHLDAMARQPQSGYMQDWIRAQRKAIRDRQFAIRC